MGLSEQAELAVRLSLVDKLSAPLRGITSRFKALDLQSAKVSRGLSNIGKGLATGLKRGVAIAGVGVALLVTQLKAGIDSLVELEDVTYQTNARIKSTKGVAGQTAESIRELAERYEDLTTVDDKVIQSAANVLLSFTNIREDAFEPAISAALDLSKALGGDATSAAKTLGKALDDPATGLSRLTRIGVTFTEEEQEKIKALQASGDLLGAQTLILDKLNVKYGDAAKAIGPAARAQAEFGDTVEETQMALATALLPALTKISQKLRGFLRSDEAQAGIARLGDAIGSLFSDKNLDTAGAAIRDVFGYLKELPWGVIKDGIVGAAAAAKTVVDVFKTLPPGVQTGLITLLAANKLGGNLIATGLGELLKVGLRSLTTITAGNVTVVGANVTGAVPGTTPSTPGGSGVVSTVIKVAAVAGVVAVGGELLQNLSTAQYEQQGYNAEQIAKLQEISTLNQSLVNAEKRGFHLPQVEARIALLRQEIVALGAIETKGWTDTYTRVGTWGQKTVEAVGHVGLIERLTAGKITDAISHNTHVLAQKKLSVTVRSNTNVRVSARQVVSESETYTRWGGVVVA